MTSADLTPDSETAPVRYEFAVGTAEPIFFDTGSTEYVRFEGEMDEHSFLFHLLPGGYTLEQAHGKEGAPNPLYVIEDLQNPGDNRVLYVWTSDADTGEIYDWVAERTKAVEAETGRKTVDAMRRLW